MKVLLITDGIFPSTLGGMQKHSTNIAKFLTMAGVKVVVAHCVDYNKKIPSDEEVNASMFGEEDFKLDEVHGFHFPKPGKIPGHYVRNNYAFSTTLFEHFKTRLSEFDFIYAKGFCGWKFIQEKKKGLSMPPIGVKFHGYEMFQPPPSFKVGVKNTVLKRPVKWNSLNADYVFSYGGRITDIVTDLGVAKEKIIEIPSGIDDSWVRTTEIPETNSPLKMVFLGRFERRKGVEELTAVLNAIKDTSAFKFTFIGPIPEDRRINHSNIRYTGIVTDPIKLRSILDEADVLVTPSYSEGMPNVILEGMARGLCVVGTDTGAVKLLVSDQTGWLMPKVSEEALKRVILSVLESNDIKAKRENALDLVKTDFVWKSVINQLIDKIDKLN